MYIPNKNFNLPLMGEKKETPATNPKEALSKGNGPVKYNNNPINQGKGPIKVQRAIENERNILNHNMSMLKKYGDLGRFDIADRYYINAASSRLRLEKLMGISKSTPQNIVKANSKQAAAVTDNYTPAYGLTRNEYEMRRSQNPDMPEYGSYEYYKDRENKLGELIDIFEKNARDYNVQANYAYKNQDIKSTGKWYEKANEEREKINRYYQREYGQVSDNMGVLERQKGDIDRTASRMARYGFDSGYKDMTGREIENEIEKSGRRLVSLRNMPRTSETSRQIKEEEKANKMLYSARKEILLREFEEMPKDELEWQIDDTVREID